MGNEGGKEQDVSAAVTTTSATATAPRSSAAASAAAPTVGLGGLGTIEGGGVASGVVVNTASTSPAPVAAHHARAAGTKSKRSGGEATDLADSSARVVQPPTSGMEAILAAVKTGDGVRNNAKLTAALEAVARAAGVVAGSTVSPEHGNLLYALATMFASGPGFSEERRAVLAKMITSNKVVRTDQITDAAAFFKDCPAAGAHFDAAKLEAALGVGVEVSDAEIDKAVAAALQANEAELRERRYHMPTGKIMGAVRKEVKFADAKVVKERVEAAMAALLGPRTAVDDAPEVRVPKKKAPKEAGAGGGEEAAKRKEKTKKDSAGAGAAGAAGGEEASVLADRGAAAALHKVGENYKTEGYVVHAKTMALLAEHVKAVGGKVVTRFPPEPNGILHIGHAKAMNFNFAYAKAHGGKTYLRYDDTNPEAEEERFFTGILDMVTWLGHKPCAVTHSSDYFQRLYELAVELIRRDLAYVDHQTAQEIYEERGGDAKGPRRESPWRARPVAESLAWFEDMRKGKVDEGKAVLRMKMDMVSGNTQLWDLVAYRVKFSTHHRTGDDWCIYPTYDFTHCLVDSFENITHSLCTREFHQARTSYYWLCNALEVYCPVQWEYSRLNLTHTVLSKRKILQLIEEGYVHDWDDPRLHTLSGLRRRGFPPAAINAFCDKVGITTAEVMYSPHMLEGCVREQLNTEAPRTMVVQNPLRVVITNWAEEGGRRVSLARHPLNAALGQRTVDLCSVLYVERDDFSEEGGKGYRRLTPAQPVGLKYANLVLRLAEAVRDGGRVTELRCTCEPATADNKPKAFIHWVSSGSPAAPPATAELRLYNQLFLAENPHDKAKFPGGFLTAYNPDSLCVVRGARIPPELAAAEEGAPFQFERLGYFCADKDHTAAAPVFNLTVSLKEDSGKSKK